MENDKNSGMWLQYGDPVLKGRGLCLLWPAAIHPQDICGQKMAGGVGKGARGEYDQILLVLELSSCRHVVS
ncbi:MAG TPA: hypothetical protein GX700_17390 [Paracoccus sp.]|nr:hypothetical protein [Paracoccus sp. (in: a-proteobacteria)]